MATPSAVKVALMITDVLLPSTAPVSLNNVLPVTGTPAPSVIPLAFALIAAVSLERQLARSPSSDWSVDAPHFAGYQVGLVISVPASTPDGATASVAIAIIDMRFVNTTSPPYVGG